MLFLTPGCPSISAAYNGFSEGGHRGNQDYFLIGFEPSLPALSRTKTANLMWPCYDAANCSSRTLRADEIIEEDISEHERSPLFILEEEYHLVAGVRTGRS